MPTFQPYAPWLITMGRSTFLGSRAVHMVSASMSKLSRTGNPCGVSGMGSSAGLERHRARAGSLALEDRGEGEHTAIRVPGADDLQSDGQSVRCEATRQRDRRVPGEIEGPEVRIPGAADRASVLARDRDRVVRVV